MKLVIQIPCFNEEGLWGGALVMGLCAFALFVR
jgi:hypothetical protein